MERKKKKVFSSIVAFLITAIIFLFFCQIVWWVMFGEWTYLSNLVIEWRSLFGR